jgi:hypothetical protein
MYFSNNARRFRLSQQPVSMGELTSLTGPHLVNLRRNQDSSPDSMVGSSFCLTSIESILTKIRPLTILQSALTKTLDLKSSRINTYKKTGGEGVFEAMWNGQTPGRRMIRIRVIKEDGRPIRAIDSVGRNLLRVVDQLPFLYAVGISSVLLSSKSKRLGDFVAATMVVHERTLEDIKPVWQAALPTVALKLGSERLTPQDLALVESFLNRREALAADVRYNTAAQIVSRLRPKLQIPADISLRNEDLLEAIASERRSFARYT